MAQSNVGYEIFSGKVTGCFYGSTRDSPRVVIHLDKGTSPNQLHVLYGKIVPPVLVGHYVEGESSLERNGVRRVRRMILRNRTGGRTLAHYLDNPRELN